VVSDFLPDGDQAEQVLQDGPHLAVPQHVDADEDVRLEEHVRKVHLLARDLEPSGFGIFRQMHMIPAHLLKTFSFNNLNTLSTGSVIQNTGGLRSLSSTSTSIECPCLARIFVLSSFKSNQTSATLGLEST
jgi:hypothetical protein